MFKSKLVSRLLFGANIAPYPTRTSVFLLFEFQTQDGEMSLRRGRSVEMQQLIMATAGSATNQKAASCIEYERSVKSTFRSTSIQIMVVAVTLGDC